MITWKNKLSTKQKPTTDATYRKVYLANIIDVANKSPTDQVARTRAMYELWCDTIGKIEKNDPKSLEYFEQYLKAQGLVSEES